MSKKESFLAVIILVACNSGYCQSINHGSGIRNVYSNPSFVEDTLNGFTSIGFGYRLFDESGKSRIGLIDQLIIDSNDTNAYSIIDFNLAGASEANTATQSIGGALVRPLSKTSKIVLGLNRVSNAGWVAQSFVRRTDAKVAYTGLSGAVWKRSITGDFSVVDREQNGGLIDSSFVSGISPRDQTSQPLNVNLFSDNSPAFNRVARHMVAIDNQVYVLNRQNKKLGTGIRTSGTIYKYRYEDLAADSAYYSKFSSFSMPSEIADSFNLQAVSVSPYLSYSLVNLDSGSESSAEIKGGVNQTWFWIRNNDSFHRPSNQSVFGSATLIGSYRKITLNGNTHVGGSNTGDYKANAQIDQWLIKSIDSSGTTELAVHGGGRVVESKPALIYWNYRSSIENIHNNLARTKLGHYYLGLSAIRNKAELGLQLDYSNLANYVYFDEFAIVKQASNPIDLYGAQVSVGYADRIFRVSTLLRYQSNNRSKLYSLPDWLNKTSVSVKWKMFHEKLGMSFGVNSIFYSGYISRGYLPFYNSYYVQTSKRFSDYSQLDAFLYAHIGSVDVGLNVINMGYGILGYDGATFPYYPAVAPGYSSIPRYFQLHINWRLKN